jgi:hypothetical protein
MENFDSEEDGYVVEAPSEEAAENEDVVETALHNQAQQGHHQPAHNDQVVCSSNVVWPSKWERIYILRQMISMFDHLDHLICRRRKITIIFFCESTCFCDYGL